jgi:hypothetical protein
VAENVLLLGHLLGGGPDGPDGVDVEAVQTKETKVGVGAVGDDSWAAHAACRDKTDLFFSDDLRDIAKALHLCWEKCPVREECLADALTWPRSMDKGIRGGLLDEERYGMDRPGVRARLTPASVAERPPHGTPQGYQWEFRHDGDTCPACRTAEARYRYYLTAALAPDDPRHGTPRGYRLGCRDDRCPSSPSCAEAEKARYDGWYANREVRAARNARRRRS